VTWGYNTMGTSCEDAKLCFCCEMCLNLCKIGFNRCMGGILLWICCFNSNAVGSQQRQSKGDSFHF
jgi:hypothetical protein